MTITPVTSATPDAAETELSRRALVVGLGISGIVTAVALRQAGWTVELVEKAAERRRGGYFIGLFDMGRHAAEHLGMVDHLHDRGKGARDYTLTRTGLGGPTVGFAAAPANVGPEISYGSETTTAFDGALPSGLWRLCLRS